MPHSKIMWLSYGKWPLPSQSGWSNNWKLKKGLPFVPVTVIRWSIFLSEQSTFVTRCQSPISIYWFQAWSLIELPLCTFWEGCSRSKTKLETNLNVEFNNNRLILRIDTLRQKYIVCKGRLITRYCRFWCKEHPCLYLTIYTIYIFDIVSFIRCATSSEPDSLQTLVPPVLCFPRFRGFCPSKEVGLLATCRHH